MMGIHLYTFWRAGSMPLAKTLMVQGTASSVGKSTLVAGLCRLFAQDGWRVAPFKAQNMALNAAVTPSGGEIGRAQAMQAEAAGVTPTVEMNPILLKPEGHARSQVIVMGRPLASMAAQEYYHQRTGFLAIVQQALQKLRAEYDLVILEGAGSPVEINLPHYDLVNMRVAQLADAPVVLVGDIDRGGIFASLLGTLSLLRPEERVRVKGLIVNKFRGDLSLWRDGEQLLAARSGVPVLGTIPWLSNLLLPEEDSVTLDDRTAAIFQGEQKGAFKGRYLVKDEGSSVGAAACPCPCGEIDRLPGQGQAAAPTDSQIPTPEKQKEADRGPVGTGLAPAPPLQVVLIRLPYLSNYDEFDALAVDPLIRLHVVATPQEFPVQPDLIILPGTKNTFFDLAWLWRQGLAQHIRRAAQQGCAVMGICGGYQMLGERLSDPTGTETTAGTVEPGLGLLPIETVFGSLSDKVTRQSVVQINRAAKHGLFASLQEEPFQVYQIHLGTTQAVGESASHGTSAFLLDNTLQDGWLTADGWCTGCYCHGLFENDHFRHAIVEALARRRSTQESLPAQTSFNRQREYDALAEALRQHLDLQQLKALCHL